MKPALTDRQKRNRFALRAWAASARPCYAASCLRGTLLVILSAAVGALPPRASGVPAVDYSTYLGAPGADDRATAIAVDAQGNAYVTGMTESPDFPVTTGIDDAFAWSRAAFAAKFSPAGALLYATLIPGTCGGTANAIAVDKAGNAYITGETGACWTGGGLPRGVLVAKLSPAGAPVYIYSFGASSGDLSEGRAIAIDAHGNAFVAGNTHSFDSDFPTTTGALHPEPCGGFLGDGFVAKVNPAGDGLVYCTYLCGTGFDVINAITVDEPGNAYVAGGTWSHDFPTTHAFQTNHPGDVLTSAGFLCRLNPTGTELSYSTYFTGSFGDTEITAIAVDAGQNAYITGATTGGKLPTTPGAFQPTPPFPNCFGALCSDAFVAKFSSEGALLFSTYIAGEQDDAGKGICLDADGHIYVAGATTSGYFPVRDAFQTAKRGGTDAFVAMLNREGSRVLFSSYLGGGKIDPSNSVPEPGNEASGLALGANGHIYLTGQTFSFFFPTTPGVFQPESAGGFCFLNLVTCGDAFVTKLDPNGPVIVPAVSLRVDRVEGKPGGTVKLTWNGIPTPGPADEIYLLKLGDPAHSFTVLETYRTTGADVGTVAVRLPSTLAPGAYEFRLFTVDPDRAPLLKEIARSEPLSITDTPGLVATVEGGQLLRLAAAGLPPRSYRVEATEQLDRPDWQVIGSLSVGGAGSSAFHEAIRPTRPTRFYRLSE